jgi:hypothetical protein
MSVMLLLRNKLTGDTAVCKPVRAGYVEFCGVEYRLDSAGRLEYSGGWRVVGGREPDEVPRELAKILR